MIRNILFWEAIRNISVLRGNEQNFVLGDDQKYFCFVCVIRNFSVLGDNGLVMDTSGRENLEEFKGIGGMVAGGGDSGAGHSWCQNCGHCSGLAANSLSFPELLWDCRYALQKAWAGLDLDP